MDLTMVVSLTLTTTWISWRIDSGLESLACLSKMKMMRLTILRSKLVEIGIRILFRQILALWLGCSISHVLSRELVNTLIMLLTQTCETTPISLNLKKLEGSWFTQRISSHTGISTKIPGKLELIHIWIDKKKRMERIIEIRETKHITEVVMEDIRSKTVRFSNKVSKKIDTTKKMKTVRNIGDLTRDSLRLIDITVLMITQGTMNIVCRSSSLD